MTPITVTELESTFDELHKGNKHLSDFVEIVDVLKQTSEAETITETFFQLGIAQMKLLGNKATPKDKEDLIISIIGVALATGIQAGLLLAKREREYNNGKPN